MSFVDVPMFELPMIGGDGAAVVPPAPNAPRSRRDKRQGWIGAGLHPLHNIMPGLRLLAGDATCGQCRFVVTVTGGARAYRKCGFYDSRSAASDLVLRWPACVRFAPKEVDQ